jgi:hypothetical protein
MPLIRLYGHRAPTPGDRQVPTLPVTKAAVPPIQTDRFFRNNKHPDASAFNQMNEQMNQGMVFRTKEAFSFFGPCGLWPTGIGGFFIGGQGGSFAGSTKRWRGAFHTSPYTHALVARVVMCPPHSNYNNDTYATLKIYSDATETTLVSTTEFHYGVGPSNVSVGGWQYHRIIDKFIEGLSADTDYYLVFSDENYGRLQSCAIADMQSMSDYNGYLPVNFTEQTQILDTDIENLVSAMPSLWKRGGAKVFNWTVDYNAFNPVTNNTATFKNVLDTSVTTVSAATPGWTLDMRYKNRLSQTTVPCVLKVCGSWLNGGSASGGTVQLVNSAGTVIATLGGGTGWNSTTPKWLEVAVNMPATLDKYDLQFKIGTAGTQIGTLSLYACSMYEYET